MTKRSQKQKHEHEHEQQTPETAASTNGDAPVEEATPQATAPAGQPNGATTAELETAAEPETTVADELAKVTAERDAYLDQLQRSRAEFANFRRRNDQERALLRDLVSRDVLIQFLPVIDDFARALEAIPAEERESNWVKGITLIQSKLNGILERAGVTPLDALGKPFDPTVHEAVATEPGTSGSTVVEVYQTGYRIGDMLLRPAMVKTGDPAPAEQAATESTASFQA